MLSFESHGFQPSYGILLVLLLWSISATAQDDSVCLKQNEASCNAKSWREEYGCIRDRISLQTALNCVRPSKNDVPDNQICRNMTYDNEADELWGLSYPDYNDYKIYRFSDGQYELCTSPRTLILETHKIMKPEDRFEIAIQGQLKACPKMEEKNYQLCLCMAEVTSYHLGIIADYFGVASYWSALMCYFETKPGVPLPPKRGLTEEDMRTFPMVKKEENEAFIQARSEIPGFDLTPDGRPVYVDSDSGTTRTARAPLPHFDENIWSGRGARRCFVHPYEAEIYTCTSWLYPSGVTRNLAGLPTMANYTRGYEPNPSFTSTSELFTRSELPSIAPVPSSSYSYSQQSVVEPLLPTSSPTQTAASSASSINVSVLCSGLLTVSVVLGVLTL